SNRHLDGNAVHIETGQTIHTLTRPAWIANRWGLRTERKQVKDRTQVYPEGVISLPGEDHNITVVRLDRLYSTMEKRLIIWRRFGADVSRWLGQVFTQLGGLPVDNFFDRIGLHDIPILVVQALDRASVIEEGGIAFDVCLEGETIGDVRLGI